jgi:hypothetical protein
MSFTVLPFKLQESILEEQSQSTLVAVSLVSKSTLYLSLSLLYRTIHIELYSKEREKNVMIRDWLCLEEVEPEEEEIENLENELNETALRQEKLFDTLMRRPAWRQFVRKVELWAVYPFDNEPQAEQFGRFLSSLSKLVKFTMLQRGRHPIDHRESRFLKDNLPKTVKTLDLGVLSMAAVTVLDLVSDLSQLESLSFGSDQADPYYLPFVPKNPPRLPHLTHLSLDWPFRSEIFFSAITTFVPSLTSLRVEYISIHVLNRSRLVNLKELVIAGDMSGQIGGIRDFTRRLPQDLLALFKTCRCLETLNMYRRGYVDSTMFTEYEKIKLLHHLPPTLETISLSKIPLSSSYLLNYLSSSSARSITRLELTLPELGGSTGGFMCFKRKMTDQIGKGKIEEDCRKRKISLTWGFS